METIYRVEGKEFSDRSEAQQYENTLLINSSKFKNGDRVYFDNSNCVATSIVTEVCVSAGMIMYKLAGMQCKKIEQNLYGSFDEYVEHLKKTVKDYAFRD